MRHPIEKYNQQQDETLANLPEESREWTARMFRVGNASYCYYNRVKELAVFNSGDQQTKPANDLLEWLELQLTPKTENRSARELLQIYFDRSADAGIFGGLAP